jgi:hypothetical protein
VCYITNKPVTTRTLHFQNWTALISLAVINLTNRNEDARQLLMETEHTNRRRYRPREERAYIVMGKRQTNKNIFFSHHSAITRRPILGRSGANPTSYTWFTQTVAYSRCRSASVSARSKEEGLSRLLQTATPAPWQYWHWLGLRPYTHVTTTGTTTCRIKLLWGKPFFRMYSSIKCPASV